MSMFRPNKLAVVGDGSDEDVAPTYLPGQILSGPNGVLECPPEEREYLLIFGDGRILFSPQHVSPARIASLKARMGRMGMQPTETPSTIAVISKAYEAATSSDVDETQTRVDLRNLIIAAIKRGGTDIRIRVYEHQAEIHFRVNGAMVLHETTTAKLGTALCVVAFNVSSTSDTSYAPSNYQASRIVNTKFDLPEQVDSLRLQFSPLENGGRLLQMRLLYRVSAGDKIANIRDLGYTPDQREALDSIRQQPTGAILVCGPTGSGKSTTLYAMLESLIAETRGELNIISIEDPIERPIAGISQIPVTNANHEEERNAKFHEAIIAALRSDPDGLMIGEIRDATSARLAFQAIQSGHFVYTTLHANNALSAPNRLREIGVPGYLLFDSKNILAIIGQRLVGVLCEHCRVPLLHAVRTGSASKALYERAAKTIDLHTHRIYHRGEGCPHCDNTGYNGQTVIAEILRPTDELMAHIANERIAEARRLWRESGARTMSMHAYEHLLAGRIDLTEFESQAGLITEAELTTPAGQDRRAA